MGLNAEGRGRPTNPVDEAIGKVNVPNEYRRLPKQALMGMAAHAKELATMPLINMILLSMSAGAFITFGAAVSVYLSDEVEADGPRRLLASLGFSIGFFLVIVSGSALFTEVNISLPVLMLLRRCATLTH